MRMRRNENGGVGLGILAAIGGLILVVGIGIGIYALVYSTADVRGRIALHNQQRSATALQFSYEYFHNTCHTVLAENQNIGELQHQIDGLKKDTSSDPFGQRGGQVLTLNTDLTGLEQQRDQTAQDYNAKTHEFTLNFMKSKDLPYEIGPPNGTAYADLTCEG